MSNKETGVEEVEKYKCKKCGVRTFEKEPAPMKGKGFNINLRTFLKFCPDCFEGWKLRVVDGIQ